MFHLGKEMILEISGKNTRTILRGWKLRRGAGYLLTDKHATSDKFKPLVPGEPVVARIEDSGVVYGISAVFVEYQKKAELMLLAIHEEIVSKALRSTDRFSCLIPTEVTMGDRGTAAEVYQGVVYDVSRGGLSFILEASHLLKPDNVVNVTFHPGGVGAVYSQQVKILRENLEDGKQKYSGMFLSSNASNENVLKQYLELCNKWQVRAE